jgi:hypothetical protein
MLSQYTCYQFFLVLSRSRLADTVQNCTVILQTQFANELERPQGMACIAALIKELQLEQAEDASYQVLQGRYKTVFETSVFVTALQSLLVCSISAVSA